MMNLIAIPNPNPPEYTMTWKCNECSHKGANFIEIVYDTAYGYEYDLECPECGALDISEDGLEK